MRYHVETYGCTMNRGEGFRLSVEMALLGHEPAYDASDADIVILNTCTVVEATEKKMLGRMSELGASGKKVIVTGCMASVQADRVGIRLPDSPVVAPGQYGSFPAVAEAYCGRGDGAALPSRGTTAILPIAQGCSGRCTYCITKLARGALESYPAEGLAREFERVVSDGSKEILVTAQDAAGYGSDIGTDLPTLLRRFLETPGDYRIRTGMSNPDSVSACLPGLIDAMSDPRVYRFLHIPVQSGSDSVLSAMGRKYAAGDFLGLIKKIRERIPGVSIATDVIAGFPGETDEDHTMTLELISALGADTVNITRFSARPGTAAYKMAGAVHGRVSKKRSAEITALKSEICLEKNERLVGHAFHALVTETGKPGTVIARTDSYRPVAIAAGIPLGTFVDVEITGAEPTHLLGRVI
ncbi:MAG: tRNA (N(6)-L-threonylcarbamoyladenosine(37)-C(2))-methylthiotransferase [Thermoplasmatales archaeon]|nr:tRNA (N(6)-L-threonylcarbamoyladenosine(37)-C(2))-methylthiotransferase [Thermoplasmatales archaeon]